MIFGQCDQPSQTECYNIRLIPACVTAIHATHKHRTMRKEGNLALSPGPEGSKTMTIDRREGQECMTMMVEKKRKGTSSSSPIAFILSRAGCVARATAPSDATSAPVSSARSSADTLSSCSASRVRRAETAASIYIFCVTFLFFFKKRN